MVITDLSRYIRSVPDFPKKGIVFKDITTLLQDKDALKQALSELLEFAKGLKIDKVVGVESRGFVFGGLLAEKLDAGFVPIRKPGKLPGDTVKETYVLEYGVDSIEIHADAIKKGDKILMHDDLLATGGTMEAACKLVEKLGGEIVQISFLVELSFLSGREKLKKYDIRSLISYDSE
ncbi:MAG: adenine phosphoribosyltransferase [Bacteroidota bacterium]|nr:adenine phosphoribosyltransferase [Bacteroidota bacterium]MDP4190858.1 adenine phosphoribosyltransferase [Bacteroidota bacterium]MDP4193895.1 adenine phosphoribosyltransferase [Bacteroidota bacterium]